MTRTFALLASIAVGLASVSAHGSEALTGATEAQVQANGASTAAQQAIDSLNDQSHRMAEEYRETLRQTEALNAYNEHLRKLVDAQEISMESLEKQIGSLEKTRREVVPLMLRMTEALERFVQLDRPFLSERRAERVTDLKNLMNQPEVGDGEKFRRLLDAYQAENDYGKTIETYRADLQTDGKTRTVDFLRIGRIALLYQTLDGKESGFWNSRTKAWNKLPSDANPSIGKGLAVARKESPPDMLTIPVELSEANR